MAPVRLTRTLWLLAALQAFALGGYMLLAPAIPSAFIFAGYSAQSRLTAGLLAAVGLGSLGMVFWVQRSAARLERRLPALAQRPAVMGAGLVALAAAVALVLAGPFVPAALVYLYARAYGLLFWAALWVFQAVCGLCLLRPRPILGADRLALPVFVVFALILASFFPAMLGWARQADEKMHGRVFTDGDDAAYDVLAINWLHGYGYANGRVLPPENYHFKGGTDEEDAVAVYKFRRPPGFPLLLSATYAVFGAQTLAARTMLAVLAWFSAFFLLCSGVALAGAPGALAAGLAALYYLNYSRFLDLTRLLTEIPTSFWIYLFCFLFVLYLKQNRWWALLSAAVALAGLIFTRVNYLPALPLLVLYLIWQRRKTGHWLALTLVVMLPLVAWSAYASVTLGRFVWMSTQGDPLFAQCNNIVVLDGLGPDRKYQGLWYPQAYESGSGFAQGLAFWRDNITQLPRLFYVKLDRGFWYNHGWLSNDLEPERYFMAGIGLLIFCLGLRPRQRWLSRLGRLPAGGVLWVQLGLVLALFLLGNQYGLGWLLAIWTVILLLALLFPYGTAFPLAPEASPLWFLVFVISHGVTTMLYLGVRYHWPMDAFLIFVTLLAFWHVLWWGGQRLAGLFKRA